MRAEIEPGAGTARCAAAARVTRAPQNALRHCLRGTYRGFFERVRPDTGRRMISWPEQMIVRLLDEQVLPWHETASRGGSPGDNQEGRGG
jgi:hypothetical protein